MKRDPRTKSSRVNRTSSQRTSDASSSIPIEEQPVEGILEEIRRLYVRLRATAEQLHRMGPLSAARRSLLVDLALHGPQTVPQLARSRPVSRQSIQTLVDRLKAEGRVETIPNPSHQRSRLVRLTPTGTDLVARMKRRETFLMEELHLAIPERDLLRVEEVLRRLRMALEGPEFGSILQEAIRRNDAAGRTKATDPQGRRKVGGS